MFIKLPITIYQPNEQLERLDIPYEAEDQVKELNVRVDHIQMYLDGGDGTVSCWMIGAEQAHIVELPIEEFELRLNGFMR